jgi:hypothetical protein
LGFSPVFSNVVDLGENPEAGFVELRFDLLGSKGKSLILP